MFLNISLSRTSRKHQRPGENSCSAGTAGAVQGRFLQFCLLLLVGGWAAGCTTGGSERAALSAKVAPTAVPAPPINFSGSARGPRVLPLDGNWKAAAAGDEIDLSVLANATGASRLLDEVREGGGAGLIALRALALAPDSAAVQGEACLLLPRLLASQRTEYLSVLKTLFMVPPVGASPRHSARCVTLLRHIQRQSNASVADRDLAATILASIEHSRESAALPAK